MARLLKSKLIVVLMVGMLLVTAAIAQTGKGSISGRVADTAGGVLPGAKVELQPGDLFAKTDGMGEFTVNGLAPGSYTVSVSYIGFAPFESKVTVVAGQTMRVEAVMKVASASQVVTVYDERQQGEVEAINRSRTADNIVQVLPAEVITSLPNANIADALGRLPSVTLERDEGEGKYVQIRGTEPRLTNVTIDGVSIPSPEGGVRQIKLDVLASDLVDSVEINKTLQANMDGDGIGGSVNLRTKTAGEAPNFTAYGIGGYTPILEGRGAEQIGATFGKRFGEQKKLGMLFGGTYDYNGRGIDDIEPSVIDNPNGTTAPYYDSLDLREYRYYRTRWGMAGSADYKLNNGGAIWVRGLFSTFQNWGDKWVYTPKTKDDLAASAKSPGSSISARRPDYAIGSLVLGGKHDFTSSWLSWGVAASRSRMLASAGNPGAKFNWVGAKTTGCKYDTGTKDPNLPQFTAACFTPGASNVTDPNNYTLGTVEEFSKGQTADTALTANLSVAKNYHLGTHFATLEFGGKIRAHHKFDNSYSISFVPQEAINVGQFATGFTNQRYYDNQYLGGKFGPVPDWNKILAFVHANSTAFVTDGGPGANEGNFGLNERVSAGYVMNTIDLSSRVRLIVGLRLEATHVDTLSFDSSQDPGTLTAKAGGDYVDALPSASLRIGITKNSGIRLVYGQGISRPDPQYLSSVVSFNPDTDAYSIGNPGLKPEHANNFDVLYEQYLNPLGMIQAGFFYKSLSDPIVTSQTHPSTGPYGGFDVNQPNNGGSAWVTGFEVAFQQHFSYLPGALNGLGVAANYSYTASQASGLDGRTDKPALLRQAPHTWNISPTYDKWRVSARLGLSYNAASIFAYQWTDGLSPLGVKGPSGDNYLYPHMQVDAQATFRIIRNLQAVVYGLNLTNEVFGFYNGSPQYVVQREYYKPTYAGGLKYTFSREK